MRLENMGAMQITNMRNAVAKEFNRLLAAEDAGLLVKPRIRKLEGFYVCGNFWRRAIVGWGETGHEAYRNWLGELGKVIGPCEKPGFLDGLRDNGSKRNG